MTPEFDDFDGLFGEKAPETKRELPKDEQLTRIRETIPEYIERCPACGGSGLWRGIRTCFKCKGKGNRQFKTSPEKRADARMSYQKRQEKNWTEFSALHQEIAKWISSESSRFEFAANMMLAVKRYGDLTENQMNACKRCLERNKAFQQRSRKASHE